MITKEINNEIDLLKSNGTIFPDDKILHDFNTFSQNLGLDVSFSVFKDISLSRTAVSEQNGELKKVSTISIYLISTQNFIKNNINNLNQNWDASYKNTEILIQYWNALLDKYKYSENYKSEKMLLFIYSLEDLIITKIVYLSKKEIIQFIDNEDINPKPEYVFCSSKPSYNIVFKNRDDYMSFISNSEKKLSNQIQKILKSNDEFNYLNNLNVKINYLHKEIENINLYGLSRED